jgi:carbonic anhydrase
MKIGSRIAGFLSAAAFGASFASGQPWTHDVGGELGPPHWGELGPVYRTCGAEIPGLSGFQETGKKQSPIDLSGAVRARLPVLMFNYLATPFEVENTGHVVEVPYHSGSELVVGGDTYQLRQFHFHAPSEHTLNGRPYPLEVHLVHADALGNNAVVGVLFEVAEEGNALVEEIFANAPADEGTVEVGGELNALSLLPNTRRYFTYSGSLTTPPCSEGVRWFVMNATAKVSAGTVAHFHDLIGDFEGYDGYANNNRPVRPLNGRTIQVRR